MRRSGSREGNGWEARIPRAAAGVLSATAASALLSLVAMSAQAQPNGGFFDYPETTLDGNISANMAVPLERCREICTERSGCAGFDYSHEAGICRMFDAVTGAKENPARTAGARNLVAGYHPPSNPPEDDAAAAFGHSWSCLPATTSFSRFHLRWEVSLERKWRPPDNGNLDLGERQVQTVRNAASGDVTTLTLSQTISIDLPKLGQVGVDRETLTLQCADDDKCIRYRYAVELSTDCNGYCGGQPWGGAVDLTHQTLRFCDANSALDASNALRKLNPETSIANGPPSGFDDPALACWVTDPSGTPLNVRTGPDGPQTDAVLHNSQRVKVSGFSPDRKGRPWAAVPGGYSFAKFMTCQAPYE